MYVHGLNINGDDAKITWQLRATDHKDALKSKAEITEEVLKLDDEEFPMFLLFAVLGDGDVNVEDKIVRLTIGGSKYELWRGIVERMRGGLGFREYGRGHKEEIRIYTSKAVALVQRWLGELGSRC